MIRPRFGKVIELTFADEGMEVFMVGDGRSALDRFEPVVPDLVLADALILKLAHLTKSTPEF